MIPSGACLLPAQLEDLFRRLEAVEIEVPVGALRRLVDLDQGEGRAGHDQRRIAGRRAQDGAGERGLAGAELALQPDDVAGFQARGQGGAELLGRGLVGEGQRKSRHLAMPAF